MKKLFVLALGISVIFIACGDKSSSVTAGVAAPTSGTASATGASEIQHKAYKIGMAVRELNNDYVRNGIRGAQSIIEGAGGTLTVVDANADVQKHSENAENLINSGIDGLLIFLGDVAHLQPIVARAVQKGIPVATMSVSAYVPGSICEVGGNNSMLGTLMGNALLAACGYTGDIYECWVPGAPILEDYKRMLDAAAKGHSSVKLHEVPTEFNTAKLTTQIEDLLVANPRKGSIAGIYGAFDALISGGNEAIRRAGRDEIKIVSIDGDRLGFQMLFQEGSPFVATVCLDTTGVGRQAADSLLSVLDGALDPATIPKVRYADCFLATRHNGIAAAEYTWGEGFWADSGLNKEEIIAKYPQNQPLSIVKSLIP